jgi:hypothetical protein
MSNETNESEIPPEDVSPPAEVTIVLRAGETSQEQAAEDTEIGTALAQAVNADVTAEIALAQSTVAVVAAESAIAEVTSQSEQGEVLWETITKLETEVGYLRKMLTECMERLSPLEMAAAVAIAPLVTEETAVAEVPVVNPSANVAVANPEPSAPAKKRRWM